MNICMGRVMLRAFALIFVLVGIAPAALEAESPGAYSQYDDVVFRPLPDRDGYTQAYSINFRGNGFRIYAVFLISNIGPKSLNNGVAVLIYRNGENRVFTSEQDYRTFQAVPGTLNYKSGPHRLTLEAPGGAKPLGPQGRLTLSVQSPQFQLELELSEFQRGLRLSGGRVPVTDDPRDFVRADVPIAFARARGKMFFAGENYELDGVGGMDFIYTNLSLHKYAKSFSQSRSYDPRSGIYVGVIRGANGFPGEYQARFAWLKSGQVERAGVIDKMEVLRTQVDPLSGYTVPVEVRYHAPTDRGEDCQLTEKVTRSAGGYSVLGSISSFLQFILRVFFARPYILHYDTEIVFACRTANDQQPYVERARFFDVQNSHYFIND